MNPFLDENFLLETKAAERLYHEYAAAMPIFDYHCHLPVALIAENKKFASLTAIWLHGDHYKWRAMRVNGVDEEFITGSASDPDKFWAWAASVRDFWMQASAARSNIRMFQSHRAAHGLCSRP